MTDSKETKQKNQKEKSYRQLIRETRQAAKAAGLTPSALQSVIQKMHKKSKTDDFS